MNARMSETGKGELAGGDSEGVLAVRVAELRVELQRVTELGRVDLRGRGRRGLGFRRRVGDEHLGGRIGEGGVGERDDGERDGDDDDLLHNFFLCCISVPLGQHRMFGECTAFGQIDHKQCIHQFPLVCKVHYCL